MLTFIIGGSGSGKSGYAEQYISEIAQGCKTYYLATMQVFDKEGQEKIRRHREQRRGKGFHTIEQPINIEEALAKMDLQMQESGSSKAILLECLSNLTANEMFMNEGVKDRHAVVEKIISGLWQLNQGAEHLVIVSNNVFEDGIQYEETTMEYIRALGKIHEKLVKLADVVIEVVVGIPVIIKQMK